MDAVAARAPCRDEKNVPTSAGSAEPVKIPVIFYEEIWVCILITSVALFQLTHIDEPQINVNAVQHGTKRSHEDCEAGNTPMPGVKYLSIGGFGVNVWENFKLEEFYVDPS
jgi:hypothetical protein